MIEVVNVDVSLLFWVGPNELPRCSGLSEGSLRGRAARGMIDVQLVELGWPTG